MFSNNKQRSAIYSQQITILGLISIFRANIYYFETDFCEDFCSLLVAIGQSSQKGTFYAIIIAAILSHPPVFFFRIFNKLRIFSVPVSDSSTVPRYILVRENMPVRGLGVDSTRRKCEAQKPNPFP